MQFNSFLFLIFFLTTYTCYICSSHKWQNRVLLVASYLFYGAWDYRFLALIFFSTAANFITGRAIHRSSVESRRKAWLWASVIINLGVLGFFKYYNFFSKVLADLIRDFGLGDQSFALHIILPVGISFYTFQAMTYSIDIYRKQLSPSPSFFDFALYISFFPQLIAGPIERASTLLPQIHAKREVSANLVKTGTFLILFGLFEKTVVADNLAVLVDGVYGAKQPDGLSTLLATYAFAFQIFADFDGYSNIAKGLAALMGFRLSINFNAPYFSETPSEFWNRWHITLSGWLRDYLYIPLGGNRQGANKTARNLLITMFLGGLWHGASWMFILWGLFHGALLVIYLPLKERLTQLPWFIRRLIFFHLVCLGWMLFRAQDPAHFSMLLQQIFLHFNFSLQKEHLLLIQKFLLYASIPIGYQYLQYRKNEFYAIASWPIAARTLSYVLLFYMIVIFGLNNAQSFIYFQF